MIVLLIIERDTEEGMARATWRGGDISKSGDWPIFDKVSSPLKQGLELQESYRDVGHSKYRVTMYHYNLKQKFSEHLYKE